MDQHPQFVANHSDLFERHIQRLALLIIFVTTANQSNQYHGFLGSVEYALSSTEWVAHCIVVALSRKSDASHKGMESGNMNIQFGFLMVNIQFDAYFHDLRVHTLLYRRI